jgi:hypothetical protein
VVVALTGDHHTTMYGATIEPAFRIILAEVHSKLNEAAGIAKAAEPCAPLLDSPIGQCCPGRRGRAMHPDEKPATQSQKILKAGTISFGGSGIDCLVRKMSGYGANLEVESQAGIPDSFDLIIDAEHSNHHCHVVWRKARRIGIAFD